MGDRANLVITSNSTANAATLKDALPGSIVMYGHWAGYNLGPDLAKAIEAARPRWDDENYGARIIVSHMIGEEWKAETGYGLYVGEIGDNERPILLVDFGQQKVRRFGEPGRYLGPEAAPNAAPTAEWSFEEFAVLDDEQARAAHLSAN